VSGGKSNRGGGRRISGKPLFAKSGFPDLSTKTLKWLAELWKFGETTLILDTSGLIFTGLRYVQSRIPRILASWTSHLAEKVLEHPRLCYPLNKGGHLNAHIPHHRAYRY